MSNCVVLLPLLREFAFCASSFCKCRFMDLPLHMSNKLIAQFESHQTSNTILEYQDSRKVDSSDMDLSNTDSRFCHTERSEVSNMESKQKLDSKIDSNKDFSLYFKS